jgi:hypothetical protein
MIFAVDRILDIERRGEIARENLAILDVPFIADTLMRTSR